MQLIKNLNRHVIAPLALIMKGDVFFRNISSNRVLNIMYHGVVTKDSTFFSPRHIHYEQFEKQIKYLKREFEVLTLDEVFENIQNRNLKKIKAVTISFDDGYLNNLNVALPILEAYKINASFFISSICLENTDYILWSEMIQALNYFYKDKIIEFGNEKFINLKSFENNKKNIFDYIKSMNTLERDEYLNQLNSKYNLISKISTLPEEIWKLMNKEELVKLSNSPFVNIGSHGHLHYNLANISKDEARIELLKSKNLLETHLNLDIKAIAYPDGSYDEGVKDLAEAAGYTQQLAVNYKLINDKKDHRILNRHGISSTTTYEANMLLLNKAFIQKGF